MKDVDELIDRLDLEMAKGNRRVENRMRSLEATRLMLDRINDAHATVNATVKTTPTEKAIINLIAGKNDITSSEMAQILSKDISTIKRAIQKLKDKGLISRIGSDKDGFWKLLK